MRTSLLVLACLYAAACGDSQVEVTEAPQSKVGAATGATSAGEAPVDLGDGLVLTVLARGGGEFVKSGSRVRVHYTASVVAVAEPEAPTEDASAEAEPAQEPAAEGAEAGGETTEAEDAQGSGEPTEGDAAIPEGTPEEADESEAEAPAEDEASRDAAPELPRRFDSSRARGVPDDWDLSRTAKPRLIEGLRRGMVGLTAGSRVTLYVPAALAWGDEGLPAAGVPPYADVLYEIELFEVLP